MPTVSDSTVCAILMDKERDWHVLAARYGVSTTCVYNYKRLRVDRAAEMAHRIRADGGTVFLWLDKERRRGKLTGEQVRRIRRDPRIHREIAEDYGIGRAMVTMIKTRKTYLEVQD